MWLLHLARTNGHAGEVVVVIGARAGEVGANTVGDAAALDRRSGLAANKATTQSLPEMMSQQQELSREWQKERKCRCPQEDVGLMGKGEKEMAQTRMGKSGQDKKHVGTNE
uniref:Uncharacterized protein n=1 Tax=Hyaloperonospora arabidopsidis (strain Emoy2) TaxID=559515 RepID=M4B6T5_HYAAE